MRRQWIHALTQIMTFEMRPGNFNDSLLTLNDFSIVGRKISEDRVTVAGSTLCLRVF